MQGNDINTLMVFGEFSRARDLINTEIRKQGRHVDPVLYKLRATCELNMNLVKDAINDATIVIASNPNDNLKREAYEIRGKALLFSGKFADAESDGKKAKDRQIVQAARNGLQAEQGYERAKSAAEKIYYLDQLLPLAKLCSEYKLKRAHLAWGQGDRQKFAELTRDIADEYPDDHILKYRLAVLDLCNGDLIKAKKGFQKVSHLNNASVALNAIERFESQRNNAELYLRKDTFDLFENPWNESMSIATEYCPKDSQLVINLNIMKVTMMKKKGQKEEVLAFLTALIDQDQEGEISAFYIERGDLLLDNGDYDGALFDYQNAESRDPRNRRAVEGIEKAKLLKRNQGRVDYYAILGIEKTASEAEVQKAYKQKVREWHPDRFSDKEKKKQAEDMMKKVNLAGEVLGDARKRQMYDLGRDPDEAGMGGPGSVQDIFEFMGDNIFNMFTGGAGDFFENIGGGHGQRHIQWQNGQGRVEFHFEF